jgi:hypothetical protein
MNFFEIIVIIQKLDFDHVVSTGWKKVQKSIKFRDNGNKRNRKLQDLIEIFKNSPFYYFRM